MKILTRNWHLGPILRTLIRNRFSAILIALQCALTLAIVINAVFIIGGRIAKIHRPTGMDDTNLISVISVGFVENFNPKTTIDTDLATLRALPGVVDVTPMNALPQSGGGSSSGYRAEEKHQNKDTDSAYYEIDEHGLNTLGLKLVSGRGFRVEDMKYLPERTTDYPHAVILSQDLAKTLFPDGNAVGKTLYSGDHNAYEIVGIVERMQAPWVNWGKFEHSALFPLVTTEKYIYYMIRTQPGHRDELMPIIEKTLGNLNNGRIIRQLRAHEDTVKKSYREDRAMAILLAVVIGLIVLITALGIAGLATFNINRRTKQIGVRRALGADQLDIIRYFLIENWITTSLGVSVGAAMTIALNYWLVRAYELDKLDWRYVPVGILFIWMLGQLSVLVPSLRASQVAPAVATRTV